MKTYWRFIIPALVIVVITGLILVAQNQQVQPAQIDEASDTLSVHFAANRDRVLFPGQCVDVSWALEGIREVYLNGHGKVGSGAEESCTVGKPPLLKVIFQNGDTKEYSLPVIQAYTTPSGLLLLFAFVLSLSVLVGLLLGPQALLVLLTVIIFGPMLRSQVNLGQDYIDHNMFAAIALDNPRALPPHFLYHISTLAFHQYVPGMTIENASFWVMLLAYVAAAIATYRLLLWLNREAGQNLSRYLWAGAALGLLLLGPISILDDTLKPGQSTALLFANTYHNPTVGMLKPIAILLFLTVLQMLRNPQRRMWILALAAAILTVLATLAKPNYTIAFAPAVVIVIAYSFIRPLPIKRLWLIAAVLVPAGLVLAWQYFFLFGSDPISQFHGGDSTIVFAPFDYYITNNGVSFGWLLLDLAASALFPILIYLFYWREAWRNIALNLSWLVFLITLAQAYFFNESPNGSHGNLTWGSQIGLFILFVVSLEFFIRKGVTLWREQRLTWQIVIAGLVLLAHLADRVAVLLPGGRF